MTQYTILNKKDLQDILIDYGIKTIESYKVLGGGSENTNYYINTETNKFVLTICEQKSFKETTLLAALLDYLNQNNFSTSKLIKTLNHKPVFEWNNKPIILKEFIEGSIIQNLPNELLTYLGGELAKLHKIKAPSHLSQNVSYGIQRFRDVENYDPDSDFCLWLIKKQAYIQTTIENSNLPKALIHSDIFYNNIIVHKNRKQATIMDFEEACYYYRIFDIGMMIIGTCCQDETIHLEKVTYLLKGYHQEIVLGVDEINAIQVFTVYAATATAFWRHQNFNYINRKENMLDHYKKMTILADKVMNISAETFKNCIKKD